MRIIITTLFSLLLFESCSQVISIHKTFPPEMVINESESLMIINQFDYKKIEFTSGSEKKQEIYRSGIEKLLSALQSGFIERNGLQIKVSSNFIVNDSILDGKIEQLCEQSQTDFILTVDNFNLRMDQFKYRNEVDEKIVSYDVVVDGTFSFFSCETNGLVKQWPLKARRLYKISQIEERLLGIKPSLYRADEHVLLVSVDLANELVSRFHLRDFFIELYIYNTKAMKESVKYINSEQYDKAIESLLILTESDDLTTSGEAANNLFVVYELLNDPIESEKWFKKALEMNQLHSSNVSN
jgi:tetratricopeptide (TPR) repeat protein